MSSALRKAGAVTAVLVATGAAVTAGSIKFASAESATATTGVNIRSGPGTDYDIVGGLFRGQKITAVGDPENGWVKVRFNGSTAYISAQYLDLEGKTQVSSPITISTSGTKFSTATLNVRSGPGLDRKVVGYFSPGQSVTLTGKQSRGWVEVLYGGERAWVSAQYLASSMNGLPDNTVTKIATADLLIRTSTQPDFKIITTVDKGSELHTTGTTKNGYAQVVYNDARRWVTARYLTGGSAAGPSVSDDDGGDHSGGSSSALPDVVGTRYAQTALNIRTTWRSNDRTVDEVPTGTKLKITGAERNGRAQVIFDGAARWVTAEWLSTSKPSADEVDSLPDVVGSRYAQTALNIRSTWRSNDRTLDEVPTGTRLKITGLRINGRAQIIFNGAKAWVTAEWLSRSRPSADSGGSSSESSSGRTKGEIALEYARAQLGEPYVWAAEGPDAFDCSGLTLRAWQAAGVNLPRTTYDQIDASPRVAKSDLRPGDLVFFYGPNPSHVGIYAGNGQIIHAPRPGSVVEYTSMSYMPFAGATRPG